MQESPSQPSRLAHAPGEMGAADLAAHLAAKLCHDLVAPAGALTMGLELFEDPDSQDMREEALALIASNARKFVALLSFNRVALGASAGAAAFDAAELERLTRAVFADSPRVELDWAVDAGPLPKPVGRALLNLAQIGAAVVATGGVVRLSVEARPGESEARLIAEGAKPRLRPDTEAGLEGAPLEERFAGHWVQAYYLNRLVTAEGGRISTAVEENRVVVRALLPQP
ncbi:MAG TPA: histidine phosphotransferase family protein [Caulobacteraceae bacterium]|nr:histidine phosphotransferase family protein [Caulobacteraceae bacterium]